MKLIHFFLAVIAFVLFLVIPSYADNLSAQILPGLYVNVPGANLSIDTLMDVNGRAGTPAPQFLTGLSSRVASYDNFGINMGAVTNTGFSYRAYYSLSYDYLNENPNISCMSEVLHTTTITVWV